ncbi:MAG: glutamine synthetase family protein [Candidatus Faecousia sp.]|nr:glutamine synthetase family protein [Candidatus Faecousia sp.]
MKYTPQEVIQYIQEADVKFIRLAFCDVLGRNKNISIMPEELERAFKYGIAIDASAIDGFGDEVHSDLFLHPDPATITVLPWRPEHGCVVRMFCTITDQDGTVFAHDTRSILKQAIADAAAAGYTFSFGSEMEFYLFKLDENGAPTRIPYDQASYMDVSPEDKCENVRREICLTLERMGIQPESSHHEQGPGQNEIDFRYSDALAAADNAVTFCTVVKTIAASNGLYADFSPKPIADQPGSGFHINMSVKGTGEDLMFHMMGGILHHVADMTRFLNPTVQSYSRLGVCKAPKYISWSNNNRSMLIRIPAAEGEYRRMELRSPDCTANPYIAFALLIWAGLDGIQKGISLPEKANVNLFTAEPKDVGDMETLPLSLTAAVKQVAGSDFIREHLPESLIEYYCRH